MASMRPFCFPTSSSFPDALKRNVRFEEGHGPKMDPIDEDGISALDLTAGFGSSEAGASKPCARLRRELPEETTLLGFCGAPWTVATYMIAGHGTPDQAPARLFAYRYPEAFDRLLRRFSRMCRPITSWSRSMPAPTRCRFSIPGRACWERRNFSATPSSRFAG